MQKAPTIVGAFCLAGLIVLPNAVYCADRGLARQVAMITNIQLLRAVAALIVVAFHLVVKMQPCRLDGSQVSLVQGGVDIFFVISGSLWCTFGANASAAAGSSCSMDHRDRPDTLAANLPALFRWSGRTTTGYRLVSVAGPLSRVAALPCSIRSLTGAGRSTHSARLVVARDWGLAVRKLHHRF